MAHRIPPGVEVADAASMNDALAAMIAAGGDLYEQLLHLQVSWWSAWMGWQADWGSELQRQLGTLPAWMIWFNGTEQLA